MAHSHPQNSSLLDRKVRQGQFFSANLLQSPGEARLRPSRVLRLMKTLLCLPYPVVRASLRALSGCPEVLPNPPHSRIPKILPCHLGQRLEPAHDLRVFRGNIPPLANILLQIVQ